MNSSFKALVYKVVKKIPKGKVATYSQVARMAGNPKAARAVGLFMKKNPDPKIIPCHRVVGTDGTLVGYALGGRNVKRKLLLMEGVSFIGKRVNLEICLWK